MSTFPEELVEALLEKTQNPLLQFKSKIQEKVILLDDKPLDYKELKEKRIRRKQEKQSRKRLGRNKSETIIKKIPKEMIDWNRALPLHEMWKEYFEDLVDFQSLGNEKDNQKLKDQKDNQKSHIYDEHKNGNIGMMNEKLSRCDLHGALLTVIKSKVPSNIGKSGIVLKESENMV